jgi:hypothetical protein
MDWALRILDTLTTQSVKADMLSDDLSAVQTL